MHLSTPNPQRSQRGFTIVELMIAVVVIGVIAALALPSFLDSIRKGRRSEALSALSAIQQAQERYRSNNRNYAGALTDIGYASASVTTRPGEYYTVQVSTDSATSATRYVATADGSASGQAGDGQCAKLGVEVNRGEIRYASCNSSCTFTASSFTRSNPCWSR
ncbi:MAG: prepilin-type N-terminal cleavage/methylation domain-containing protein [Rubrivivax sp.]|nr:prepilin-type N-terminal cleavage/methylation domain-containing protein [Rubrivivax sp.]